MKIANVLMSTCTAALLLSGCMTEEPIKQRVADDRILLIENNKFSAELLSAKTLINDDGLLTVDADVLLSRTAPLHWVFCGDPKLTVWYHFDWIDAQGNVSTPLVQYEMSALPGNVLTFHGVAPAEKYINYRLTISLRGKTTEEEAAQAREEIKKQYSESGRIKPAGKSQAKQMDKKQQSAKKPAAKKAPAKKPAEKPGKLTEPFN